MVTPANPSEEVKAISENVAQIISFTGKEIKYIRNSFVSLNNRSTDDIRHCWRSCSDTSYDYLANVEIRSSYQPESTLSKINSGLLHTIFFMVWSAVLTAFKSNNGQ